MDSEKLKRCTALVSIFLLMASAFAGQEERRIVSIPDPQVIQLPGNNIGRSIPQMPGWPIHIGKDSQVDPIRGVVFADLNNDGQLEIVTSSTDNKIYAWDYTGTPMPGFPVSTNDMCQYAPSVGDLDHDGCLEIVQFTGGYNRKGWLYVLDHVGQSLPGFPIGFGDNRLEGSPCLQDLDNDGDLEILVPERANNNFGSLHVFEKDGSEWGGNWPFILDDVAVGTPAVGDVDGDGVVEIVILSEDSIYALEVDGTVMTGWPRQVYFSYFRDQSPALADLNQDGDLEIVVGSTQYNQGGCLTLVYHHDGSVDPAWPRKMGTYTFCPPTITDLEGDGELEILNGGWSNNSPHGCFYAWTATGKLKSGFPYTYTYGHGSGGPLTVADINGDGYMEIFADYGVLTSNKGFLFGVDHKGNDLPDFPLRPTGWTWMCGPTIGDVDGDGDYEMGVLTYDTDVNAYVNLYDFKEAYHPANISWGTYHNRNERGALHRGENRLNIQGYFGLDSPCNIYLHDEPDYRAFLLVSLDTGKAYHKHYGWFYLGMTPPMPFMLLYNVPIPKTGELKLSVVIPKDPAFSGLTFCFQGLTGKDPFQNDILFTNMLARTVQ